MNFLPSSTGASHDGPGLRARGSSALPRRRHLVSQALPVSTIFLTCALSADAADITKANNTDNLNLGSSWVSGQPGTSDYATWSNTVTGPNAVSLGADLTWGGIKIASPGGPGGPVTIQAGNTLNLSAGAGSTTISMGTATQNLTLNNNVTLGASQTWNAGAGVAINANGILGGGSGFRLTKAGTGTLNLSNAGNSYSGGTTVSAGTLSFTNGALGTTGTITVSGGRLQWASGNTQDISSRLTTAGTFDTNGNNVTFGTAIGGTGGLTKFGGGTLTLQGFNAYSGTTTVQGGTLQLDYSGVNDSKLANGAKLILKGGTLELAGGDHTEAVLSTELYSDNSGWGGKANTVTRSSGSAVLQMNSLTRATVTYGATIDFAQAGIATTDTVNTNSIIGGWATVGGSGWAANSTNGADGSITALTAGSYTNDTWAAGNNVTVTTNSTQTNATANSLRFNDAGARTVTLSGTNVLTSGGLMVTGNVGANATTITGGTLTATGGQDLVLHQYNTKGDLTISSAIANNGASAVALTKSGDGKVILTTAASHTGGTYINAGVLNIQGATNMFTGSGGRIYIGPNAALELENGGVNSSAHAAQLAGTGISNGGAIRNVAGDNTYGSVVNLYADSRINSDSGTLTLSQTVSNSASWNSSLYVGGAGNVTMSNNVTGSITLIKDGTGTLTLGSATNTYAGGTVISGGALAVSNLANLSTGMVTLNGGTLRYTGATASATRYLTLNSTAGNAIEVGSATATLTNTGSMSGSGGFTKTGTGTLELTSANTYTGKTTVSAGTLKLSGSGSIGASTTIEVGPNATLDVSSIAGFTLGSQQTLTSTGTVIGTMNVSGTLSPGNSPGTLTTGSEIWLNGGDYNWQMHDAAGAAGTGYDTIAISGTLDLSSLDSAGFAINLWSLAAIAPDANGDALNFTSDTDASWVIASASGGIIGFEAADFALNLSANNGTAGFSNATNGGMFTLSQSGNNLVLSFAAAVPEPSAALLGGLGALVLLRRRKP